MRRTPVPGDLSISRPRRISLICCLVICSLAAPCVRIYTYRYVRYAIFCEIRKFSQVLASFALANHVLLLVDFCVTRQPRGSASRCNIVAADNSPRRFFIPLLFHLVLRSSLFLAAMRRRLYRFRSNQTEQNPAEPPHDR